MTETRRPPGAGGPPTAGSGRCAATYTTCRPWPCTGPGRGRRRARAFSRSRIILSRLDRVVVVLDAVVEAGRVAVKVLLHPDGVLGHDDRLAAGQLHLDRLVAQGVARRAEDHDGAVAEQVVVALELQVVEVARRAVEVAHHEHAAAPLELLGPPRLVQLLLLDHVNGLGEELDVADVVEVGVRGDDGLHLVRRVAELLELPVDDVVALLARLEDRRTVPAAQWDLHLPSEIAALLPVSNTTSPFG